MLQVPSLLTIQEMLEVSLLIPNELMNLHPAVKSPFKVWGRQRRQIWVITAPDASAAKDLGKRSLGCKKEF